VVFRGVQLLADRGYDPGSVDGVIGSRTRAAVRGFQADAGLPVDGEISDELYAALTDAVGGQGVAARQAPTEPRLDSTGTGFAVTKTVISSRTTMWWPTALRCASSPKARRLLRPSSSLATRTMISLCLRPH
jgi:hypothetical protein